MRLIKIHEDKRGYTHSIEDENLGVPEITMFFTKKGYARGGCVHNKNEIFCVVTGTVDLILGDEYYLLADGISVAIPKRTPHYFVAKSDSIVLEWGISGEEKGEKDPDYRAIVDRINDTADRT